LIFPKPLKISSRRGLLRGGKQPGDMEVFSIWTRKKITLKLLHLTLAMVDPVFEKEIESFSCGGCSFVAILA